MKTSEILYRAAHVMMERGRCPDDFADGRGRVCMLGAINIVLRGDPWKLVLNDDAAEMHLERVLGEGVPEFSNNHCKSKEDCAAAFEIAADIAAAEGK